MEPGKKNDTALRRFYAYVGVFILERLFRIIIFCFIFPKPLHETIK